MRIRERNVYVGPSLYAHFPVIRLLLDLGALEDWPTARLGPVATNSPPARMPFASEFRSCKIRLQPLIGV